MSRHSRQSRPRSRALAPASQPAYARTTITVPRELKARMEKAAGRVNWSAVACQAFESRLSELEQQELPVPELPDKDDALERLRRLKNEPEPRQRAEESSAYLLGKHWAMADAHPKELQRLEEFCRHYEINRPVEQWKPDLHNRHAFKQLFRDLTLTILGYDRITEIDQARTKMKPFWEQRVGLALDRTRRPDAEFVSGFTQGALRFWEDVKHRL